MTIASLLNLTSPRDFTAFSFANADHHMLALLKVNKTLGLNLTTYVLDPIPEFDTLNWLRRHQQAHTDLNNLLGIQGADLTDVDFKKQTEREAWAELHYFEHLQFQQSLGI